MKFKFGNIVKVTGNTFYSDVCGTVVGAEEKLLSFEKYPGIHYTVRFSAGGCGESEEFHESELVAYHGGLYEQMEQAP
jgi:hypothetical protein